MAIHAEVTITNNVITAVPDPLPMGKPNNQVIEWTIKTDNWTFPDDGIVINSDLNDQFSGGAATGNGKKYTLHNKNTDSNRYKYTVNVANGSTRLDLDPIIINQS